MSKENLEHLNSLLALLEKGEFIKGMEAYFDDAITIQEVGQTPKSGKSHNIAVEEELLSGVSEFIQYTAHSIGAGDDKTFYEATMEFKTKDGQHVKQQQAVVTTWKDGKIIDEKYYHKNA